MGSASLRKYQGQTIKGSGAIANKSVSLSPRCNIHNCTAVLGILRFTVNIYVTLNLLEQ